MQRLGEHSLSVTDSQTGKAILGAGFFTGGDSWVPRLDILSSRVDSESRGKSSALPKIFYGILENTPPV